jgi:hypothetical protein
LQTESKQELPTIQVTMVLPWQQEVTWNPCQKTIRLLDQTQKLVLKLLVEETTTRPVLLAGSCFEMSQCGQNKAKNLLKQKGEHDEAMKQMAGELSRVNAEQALMRKTMQWKLYYKMCNKEGDVNGKKSKTGTQRSSRHQQ